MALRLGQRVPALLALTRFLILEPGTGRSVGAVRAIRGILNSGATRSGDEQTIKITLAMGKPAANKAEGDFGPEETGLAIVGAARLMKETANPSSEFSQVEYAYVSLLETLGRKDRAKQHARTFVGQCYLPYFRAVVDRKWVGAMVSYAFQSAAFSTSEDERPAAQATPDFLEWSRKNASSLL